MTTHAASVHGVALAQLTFDFYMIGARPENLIDDRAYEGDQLDEMLRGKGPAMTAPHLSNRKCKIRDGRRPHRYERL